MSMTTILCEKTTKKAGDVIMMQAIKKLGDYMLSKSEDKSDIAKFLERLVLEYVVTVNLENSKGELRFVKVDFEEFEKKKIPRYLYRSGPPNGTDMSPSSKITDIRTKTFPRVTKCVSNILKNEAQYNIKPEEKELLVSVQSVMESNSETIIEQIEKINPKSKSSNLLTIKIDNKYPGDFDIFKRVLVTNSSDQFYSKYGEESRNSDKTCSICLKKKDSVYGFVSTFPFYTVDKAGMVTGGFLQSESWKNYPVCPDCAATMECGKKYLKENLDFSFYGFRYLMIPHFLSGETMTEIMDVLENYQKNLKIGKAHKIKLSNDENDILELLSEQKDNMSVDLMFYEEKQSGKVFNILLHIEEVLPSRFCQIFKEKRRLDNMEIFSDISYPDDKTFEFNFSVIRNFFPNSRIDPSYDKSFLEITDKIFRGTPIKFNFILHHIVEKFRLKFNKDESLYWDCMRSLMLLHFLNNLGILNRQKREEEKNNMTDSRNELIESFFKEHKEFFGSSDQKAVFLTGVLTQYLLDIQGHDRKAQPFRKRLKGLKMDMKDVCRVFSEAQNKLEEYKKNYYRDLEKIISSYFILFNPDKSLLSKDEINFYFVMGMNLASEFKTKKEETTDEQ